MALTSICSADATLVIQGIVYPLAAVSSIVTALIIGISYMLGNALSSPRLILWSKTEVFQLFISVVVVGFILMGINTFCLLDIGSIYSLLDIEMTGMPPGMTIFDAANNYLVEGGIWLHDLFSATRYHLGGYSILQSFGRNQCEGDPSYAWLFCLFGAVLPSITGGSGAASISVAPDAGYGLLTSVLGAAFNTITMAYLSILNYMFILKYVFSGFILFFLPLGIFLRALPYVRTLGSLLMSVAIAFLMIYPLVLSIFYIDFKAGHVLTPRDSPVFDYSDKDLADQVTFPMFDQHISDNVFDSGEQSVEIIKLSGNAFLVGIFIPSLALLAAAAAVGYINKFLGEEIDLSRIVQLM
ncbi:MAG: hypothetical protein V1827_01685 [Candidatus Micrarchaeota archaeon]